MPDIQITVRRAYGKFLVVGCSVKGARWIRRNMWAKFSIPQKKERFVIIDLQHLEEWQEKMKEAELIVETS